MRGAAVCSDFLVCRTVCLQLGKLHPLQNLGQQPLARSLYKAGDDILRHVFRGSLQHLLEVYRVKALDDGSLLSLLLSKVAIKVREVSFFFV